MVRASKKDKEENKNGEVVSDKSKRSDRLDKIEEELHQIIELVNSANLEELEIREGKKRVRIKKRVIREKEELFPEVSEEKEETSIEIDKYEKVISPLTGVFYRASGLDDEPYVDEGDVIEAGKTLCLIEAMKLFNEIKSDIAGKIIKIMVKNGEQVKEGQILFLLASGIET